MSAPILSILTPAVPSRLLSLEKLIDELDRQISSLNPHPSSLPLSLPPVEHLVLLDNKRRPVGAKRQALLDIARGDYVAFVDDDDWISPDYIAELLPRCESGPDVITFEQEAVVNGVSGQIHFDLACRLDEPWKPGATALRRPWHICAWSRKLALQGVFTEVNYGEDRAWVDQVAPLARTYLHIPKILHHYRHDAKSTEAPPP